MARRGEFTRRRRARCSAAMLREMLGSVPGSRPLQKYPLAAELYRFLRSGLAAPLLRNGSEEGMEDLVLHFLTDHGEQFWVFDHEICGYDHMYGDIADALLDVFVAVRARLFIRRGASAQQHQQQPQPQQQQQQQQQQQEKEDGEDEDDEEEDMMAPLGFALSGVAPTATTTTPPTPTPAATTTVLAFRPTPGAEEERIE